MASLANSTNVRTYLWCVVSRVIAPRVHNQQNMCKMAGWKKHLIHPDGRISCKWLISPSAQKTMRLCFDCRPKTVHLGAQGKAKANWPMESERGGCWLQCKAIVIKTHKITREKSLEDERIKSAANSECMTVTYRGGGWGVGRTFKKLQSKGAPTKKQTSVENHCGTLNSSCRAHSYHRWYIWPWNCITVKLQAELTNTCMGGYWQVWHVYIYTRLNGSLKQAWNRIKSLLTLCPVSSGHVARRR